jgi:hypothetical protein
MLCRPKRLLEMAGLTQAWPSEKQLSHVREMEHEEDPLGGAGRAMTVRGHHPSIRRRFQSSSIVPPA